MRNALEEAALEIVAEGADADGVLRERFLGELSGFAEADDAGDIFGAGAKAALVVAAVEELLQRRAGADVERADSFGAVNFVGGEGKQIDLQGVYVDGQLAGGLHGVGVEVDFEFGGEAADFFEGWTVPSSLLACMTEMRAVSGISSRRV